MLITLGIDEAGRGCVIGPMVIACVAADPADRRWFAAHRVRDSKVVPGAERDRLAAEIKERCWFQLRIALPSDIDCAVADRSRTLNGLELEHMADLLRDFVEHDDEADAYALIDAPSINAQGFLERLFIASGWSDMSRLHARHEADRSDRTVAAASIIAKAERERLLARIKQEVGIDLGCGYSHDERTRSFVASCPPDSPHVRWSWATAKTCRVRT